MTLNSLLKVEDVLLLGPGPNSIFVIVEATNILSDSRKMRGEIRI